MDLKEFDIYSGANEAVADMLPQIPLGEKKKENPFKDDEKDFYADSDKALAKAETSKQEPIKDIVARWENQLNDPKNKKSYKFEDVDDVIINYDTKVDIPRDVRKAIAVMVTLEAKIAHAGKLNYEKDTVRELKAELLKKKNELRKFTDNMSKEEKIAVNKLIAVGKKNVTKDDLGEKDVNENGDEYDVKGQEIAFSLDGMDYLSEGALSDGLLLVGVYLLGIGVILAPYIVAAIKEARNRFRKIKDNDLPKNYRLSDDEKKKIKGYVDQLKKSIKSEVVRAGANPVEKRDGKVVSYAKDYIKEVKDKENFAYYTNKKHEYLYVYTNILYEYEAPFSARTTESAKIENAARQISQEIASELKSLPDECGLRVYFFHNGGNDAKTYGQIIVYEEKILKEKTDVKLSKVEEKVSEINNEISDLYFKYRDAEIAYEKDGNDRFTTVMRGTKAILEKQVGLLEKTNEEIMTEKADMEKEIKPIVDKLESKGYMVWYASPGHSSLRSKEDKEPDGVYKGKLYSDARIMFEKKYNFPEAPKHWKWREVDGCSYLDIVPGEYNDKNGTPDEAFMKWKSEYMSSLVAWVEDLKENGSEVKESYEGDLDMMISNMIDLL